VCAEQGVAKMPCQNLQMQGIFMGHFFYSAVCYLLPFFPSYFSNHFVVMYW
jgi:hypothetical protein